MLPSEWSQLDELGACNLANGFLVQRSSLDDAWKVCHRGDWMAWYLAHDQRFCAMLTDLLETWGRSLGAHGDKKNLDCLRAPNARWPCAHACWYINSVLPLFDHALEEQDIYGSDLLALEKLANQLREVWPFRPALPLKETE